MSGPLRGRAGCGLPEGAVFTSLGIRTRNSSTCQSLERISSSCVEETEEGSAHPFLPASGPGRRLLLPCHVLERQSCLQKVLCPG